MPSFLSEENINNLINAYYDPDDNSNIARLVDIDEIK